VANGNTTTISVIDADTCNATSQARCGHARAMTANSPVAGLAIDQRTGTVSADLQFCGSEELVFEGRGATPT
jgi:aldehyde:ferredoxin oxidoreductase